MRQPGEKRKIPIDIYLYWKIKDIKEELFKRIAIQAALQEEAGSLIPQEGLEMKQNKTYKKCEYVSEN